MLAIRTYKRAINKDLQKNIFFKENTTGALRNISYGLDQNKITINVAEGVAALNKALRRATVKLQDQQSTQSHQWSLVQVHAAGALWNLSR